MNTHWFVAMPIRQSVLAMRRRMQASHGAPTRESWVQVWASLEDPEEGDDAGEDE